MLRSGLREGYRTVKFRVWNGVEFTAYGKAMGLGYWNAIP